MNPIKIPKSYNYIGVFLTFGCNLKCSYCINNFEGNLRKRKIIPGKDWVRLINRMVSRDDLPVTLQGGEPSIHPDFIYIINRIKLELNIDILTNLQFDLKKFIAQVDPLRIKRKSPYASIRVSYHPQTMRLDDTIERVLRLLSAGFSVGIWSVVHPYYKTHILAAQKKCLNLGIDFRTKEFLGAYKGRLYGRYKYPQSCSKKTNREVLCRTTEFLIDPQGLVFGCHHDVYQGITPLGSLFDNGFKLQRKFRKCSYYGFCNPCDVKIKTNRFQQFGHTSVEIKI